MPAKPVVPSTAEGLFSPGAVRLFGLPYDGLQLGNLALPPASSHPIAKSLADAGDGRGLARIYGFSYLGNYFKLPEPIVFLVFAPGAPAGTGDIPIATAGTEYTAGSFAAGVMVWTLDQLDMTVRIDVKIGWVKDLLLGEMDASNNMTGGDAVRRADIVGRDSGSMVGRDGSLVGRDGSMIGRNR